MREGENKKRGKKESDLVKESNLTYDDYASIDDGNRYELADGQLQLMSPAPSVIHQLFSYELQKELSRHCESEYFIIQAPLDVILSSNEVRQPDLVLVHRDRLSIISKRGIEGPPDLVVEIISPSTLKRDKVDKLKTYAKYQILEYWLVEPETGVLEEYSLEEDKYELVDVFQGDKQITSPNLPCISLTMAKLMNNIPEHLTD
ncbi:Uma2 family endonuclease [Virgibacillus sp. MSP4-1]|uniref:Uma2 family endonuclease n=1 Tax=Virgibacillus sp. MSP4-1 TaxID=2700081 RepID=UPI0003A9F2E1|nr:Uma2 family endonuclease [Virgibacillus sp. MSP4-1]QHS21460.1 Uma2 family endonuclease [Virgibacillus sp. MSP4-1]